MKLSSLSFLTMAVLLVSVMGCGADDDSQPPETDTGMATEWDANFIYGQIIDAETDRGLRKGTVTMGDETVELNNGGYYALIEVAMEAREEAIEVVSDGYAPFHRNVSVVADGIQYLEITLAPWTVEAEFEAADGVTLEDDKFIINIPASALAESGTLTAKAAYVDASKEAGLLAMPGSLEDNEGDPMWARGAAYVQVEDEDGNILELADGKKITITIPENDAQDGDAAYTYSKTSAAWNQPGNAACESTTCVFSASKLDWWMVGQPLTAACTKVDVTNSSANAVAGAVVEAVALDGFSRVTGFTENSGQVCLNTLADAEYRIITPGSKTATVNEWLTDVELDSCGPEGFCLTMTYDHVAHPALMQMVLNWGEEPKDLDLHLTGPCPSCDGGRFNVSFQERGDVSSVPFAYIDTFDTVSYGPEVASVYRCLAGTYRVYVQNTSGNPGIESSAASVAIRNTDGHVNRILAPTSNPDSLPAWLVADLPL